MTTCTECLEAIATSRLSDLHANPLVQAHCATCAQCSQVAEEVSYAEKRLATTLSELRPGVPSYSVASGALTGAERIRRRAVARWIRRGLAAFGAFLLATYFVEKRRIQPSLETKTIPLMCITSEAATDIVTPYLRASGSAVWSARGLRAITVRGTHAETEKVISLLDAFEQRYCNLPDRGVTPSDDKQGKD